MARSTTSSRSGSTRSETDSFGPIEVAADRYWGAQTERSRQNFRIGHDRMPMPIIHALGIVKLAAAETNRELGLLDQRRAGAIIRAAREVIDGKLDDHFPLVVWQTGSGTQTNMNLNEVIANRANELLGGKLGAKQPVHPNDHVNMSQSSNDSFPTAMHIAAAHAHRRRSGSGAERTAARAAQEAKGVRPHRQDRPHPHPGRDAADARPGIFRLCRAGRERHRAAARRGERSLSAGARRHRGRHRTQFQAAIRRLFARHAAKITKLPFTSAANKFEALASNDAYVFAHGAINSMATGLFKIANDIRLLGSGPRSGLGELILPENEPGSSIMPGKVNPTQCEAVTMVCCQVFGNHTAITVAGSQGHFELNVYKPVLAYCMMHSIQLLADVARSFTEHCVEGIRADEKRIRELMQRSLMLVTALAPKIGYDNAAKVAKSAHARGTTLKEEAVRLGFVSAGGVRSAGAAGQNDAPGLITGGTPGKTDRSRAK